MKTKHAVTDGSSRIPFTSICSTLLLTVAALLGPGGGDSTAATFPAAAQSERTFSIGVFRMTITDPVIQSWFLQQGLPPAAGSYSTYPGYKDPTSTDPAIIAMAAPVHTLSSPVMHDRENTVIGESAGYVRPLPAGPIQVGDSAALAPPLFPPLPPIWPVPPAFLDYSSFTCPSLTPHIPFLWVVSPPPPPTHREMLTRIENFALIMDQSCGISDPRVPTCGQPAGTPCPNVPMVAAGPGQGVALQSIGMVQSLSPSGLPANDFPARSFFNIYVEVNLPAIPFTKSAGLGIFPPAPGFPLGAAVLYNDCDNPLVIQNLNISSNPPNVVYIHGTTPAVPMKFKYSNPGYWNAGDTCGMMVLAGHGVGLGCFKSQNDLLDQVFGPTNAPIAGMPIGWMYPRCDFPAPGAAYASMHDIDVLNITDPLVGTVKMRNINLFSLLNGIPLPPSNTSATYSTSNAAVTLELSIDGGLSWSPTTGGGSVAMSIKRTEDSYGWQSYDTEITSMDLTCGGLFPFKLRESPTKASLGQHRVRAAQGGYEIASSFDISYEATFDNVQWIPGEKPHNQQVQTAPCGVAGIQLHVQQVGPNLVISWLGSGYQLQGSPTLVPSAWTNIPNSSSPVTLPIASGYKFFRLICP